MKPTRVRKEGGSVFGRQGTWQPDMLCTTSLTPMPLQGHQQELQYLNQEWKSDNCNGVITMNKSDSKES